jgi:hypothetical protein
MATNNIGRVTEASTAIARADAVYLASTKDLVAKLTHLATDADSATAADAALTALNTKRIAVGS